MMMPTKVVSCFFPPLRFHLSSGNIKSIPGTGFYYSPAVLRCGGNQMQRFQFLMRHNSSQQQSPKSSTDKALTEARQDHAVSTALKEKVKENVKTSAYGGVVLIGIAVAGAMAYLILSELFSSDSPNSIYTKSFKLCKSNDEVQDVLGEPIKCYGEETRRGWRRHVAHQKFIAADDTKYIRMKFYVEGKFNKGTVYLEKKTNAEGKFKYSYLVVDVETYPPRRIEIDVSNM